jgi:hypothetical protein
MTTATTPAPVRRCRAAAAGGALVLAGALLGLGAAAAQGPGEVEAQLVGFVARLPAGRLTLPPAEPATARLEVPNEQGGERLVFTVELTPRTQVFSRTRTLRDGELVALEGVVQRGRLRVERIREVDVVEFPGRVALREGALALPVAADRLVAVVLDGSTLPLTFVLTPRTLSTRTALRDGEPVTLAVVNGGRLVVGIESAAGR